MLLTYHQIQKEERINKNTIYCKQILLYFHHFHLSFLGWIKTSLFSGLLGLYYHLTQKEVFRCSWDAVKDYIIF